MIPGTSKTLSKSGPGDLRIITKMLQETQEKYGIILEKYYFWQYETSEIRNFSKSVCPRYQMLFDAFRLLFGFAFDVFADSLVNFLIYIWKIILRRWGLKNATFSITKQHTDLDLNFISIKKHEQKFTLNFFIFKDGTLNFVIFKKGNHITLNSR